MTNHYKVHIEVGHINYISFILIYIIYKWIESKFLGMVLFSWLYHNN